MTPGASVHAASLATCDRGHYRFLKITGCVKKGITMAGQSSGLGLTTPGYLHRGLDALFEMARATPLAPECESFYFIRHGETDGNHKRISQHAEIPLTARGLAQAEAA